MSRIIPEENTKNNISIGTNKKSNNTNNRKNKPEQENLPNELISLKIKKNTKENNNQHQNIDDILYSFNSESLSNSIQENEHSLSNYSAKVRIKKKKSTDKKKIKAENCENSPNVSCKKEEKKSNIEDETEI